MKGVAPKDPRLEGGWPPRDGGQEVAASALAPQVAAASRLRKQTPGVDGWRKSGWVSSGQNSAVGCSSPEKRLGAKQGRMLSEVEDPCRHVGAAGLPRAAHLLVG